MQRIFLRAPAMTLRIPGAPEPPDPGEYRPPHADIICDNNARELFAAAVPPAAGHHAATPLDPIPSVSGLFLLLPAGGRARPVQHHAPARLRPGLVRYRRPLA